MKPSTIAIVGMAGRFPGARNLTQFWQNLHDGVEAIRDRSDADLLAAGATPEDLASPEYVKRASILDDVPLFDASFFGLSPRDASIMDPQHRHFLECAWETLESAGHVPQHFRGSIGVFAGSGMNTYLINNLLANRRLLESAGLFQLKQTGNDKDVLATRASYHFDLRGPSINIQTACSTSLVAVHLACQSLLDFECDMALAGGVTIEIPHGLGYLYREGEILSRDGHCRSFDSNSSGTVFASGLGIVALRRLEDALEDRDHIHAVILGSAIDNDGARKVGYLAPSVEGQAEVIAEALAFAGVTAGDISYVEAHGTGTVVGDPIEVRALTQAFRKSTAKCGYCGIGSLKSSVGHLDTAAGVAGLIKTVLALEHGQLPASLNFNSLNPHIELKDSPFFINSTLKEWPPAVTPRRAGVTALGIGGTNAHVILEEAPPKNIARQHRQYQLLTVSAKSENAADQAFANLADYLSGHPEVNLADAAFTCQQGRHAFQHRRAFVVEDTAEAIAALASTNRKKPVFGVAGKAVPQVAFMFSGQGSQYVNMGRELFENEPVFCEALIQCSQHLREPLGVDLIKALYPPDEEKGAASEKLNQTWLTQPALFAIEYSLAQWWMSLGVRPAAMVGHSIGEYVAACLAGVFSLADALAIVTFRGRLIFEQPAGAMLAVPQPATEVQLPRWLSMAAINNPGMCVVSGPTEEIAAFEESLGKKSIDCRRLFTSHAFHSGMMDPILAAFEERLRTVTFRAPHIPYLSNVSGTWIKSEEAADPAYWARHIRSTVRFSDNLAELFKNPEQILIEAGPGNVLTSLARQQGGAAANAFQSLPHPRESVPAQHCALTTLGQLWTLGAEVDWSKLNTPGAVQRIPLPTYPFEHQRFWIEPDAVHRASAPADALATQAMASEEMWLYRRNWKPAPLAPVAVNQPCLWIIFRDSKGMADRIATTLRATKNEVILVDAGTAYRQNKKGSYIVRAAVRKDYDTLLADVLKAGAAPRKILHLWSVEDSDLPLEQTLERSFCSPLYLAQALADLDLVEIDIALVSNHMQQVGEEPVRAPARAVLLGPARVIPKELPGITCRAIDLNLEGSETQEPTALLIAEMTSTGESATVAYRNGQRFMEYLDPFNLSAAPERRRLERGGVYLITGGLGGLSLVIAEYLAREFKAHLVLVGRSPLPPEAQWETALADPQQAEADKGRIRKLLEIRVLAGGLLLAQADVTNPGQMRDTVARARKQFGKIDGVFHAAGVLDDGPLMLKSADSAARVLAPKVRGTLVLEDVLGDAPLAFMVLFSSISSILPPAGQVDYAAANAFLDAFAVSRGGKVTVVNWGLWREVGMGVRSASPHPWLEQRLLNTTDAIVYAGQFSQQSRWVLSEHRFQNGISLIPGTGHMEMVAGAFMHGSLQGSIEFRDVYFLAPLMCANGETKEVRVQLQRDHEAGPQTGAFRFSVFATNSIEKLDDWVEHSTGTIAPCQARTPGNIDLSAIAARCCEGEIVFDEEHRTRQERQFVFGPRWRSLRRLQLGKFEGLAEIELEERFNADVLTLRQHPALLDMATGAALYLTDDYENSDDLFLPISYKKMCAYRPLPAHFYSHIRPRRENGARSEIETFDITLIDEQNQVLAEIDGFSMRRIVDPSMALEEKIVVREEARSSTVRPIAISAPSGILPRMGAKVLTRILLAETPTGVVVAAEPLAVPDKSAVPAPKIAAATSARPSSVEGALVLWWQDLLGVDSVGLDDDFFGLGGHSLIGVRLFAKIKKTWQVDLELAVLFEARTVRQLAALIRKAQQPAVVVEQKNWSTLVPIQPNGTRIPLFCVHAVGGDVLFYEQLAKALGPDQPFYAFKSPLIAQTVIGETSVEELASIYVREMRAFYPQGPYLIGGASYGGLVAYEMAKQLHAQGADMGLLLLFDTSVPGSEEILPTTRKLSGFGKNLREQGLGYLRRKIAEKSQYWRELAYHRARVLTCTAYRLAGLHLPMSLRYFQMDEAHRRAIARYVFTPYAGKVTLMRAIDRGPEALGKREDPALGWGALAEGGLQIYNIPTQHMYMLFEPYVSTFAKTLKTILPQ